MFMMTFSSKYLMTSHQIPDIKVHSHIMSEFAFVFDLCHFLLENANVKCEHHNILRKKPLLKFDANSNADVTPETRPSGLFKASESENFL